jgi:hypothetical protein
MKPGRRWRRESPSECNQRCVAVATSLNSSWFKRTGSVAAIYSTTLIFHAPLVGDFPITSKSTSMSFTPLAAECLVTSSGRCETGFPTWRNRAGILACTQMAIAAHKVGTQRRVDVQAPCPLPGGIRRRGQLTRNGAQVVVCRGAGIRESITCPPCPVPCDLISATPAEPLASSRSP